MVTVALLLSCRYCRNSIRYLYSPWFGWQQFRVQAARRLRALPDHHRDHTWPGCADAARPIRWQDRARWDEAYKRRLRRQLLRWRELERVNTDPTAKLMHKLGGDLVEDQLRRLS